MDRTELVEAALAQQRCTLWGRAWDLSQPESREGAKLWLLTLLDELEGLYEADR